MSLRHIMLGMLREPSSGYDIRKRFEKSVGNFWRAELSQIYPLLQKMEGEGLLRSKAGQSDIGPTRRVYKRTASGLRELRDWIALGSKGMKKTREGKKARCQASGRRVESICG